jgi:Putative auto-transporter adhesin, head GIN domain
MGRMKIFLIAFATIVLGALATIATVSLSRSAPAGTLVHETRELAGFRRIDVSGQATVTLIQGTNEGVTVDAPASIRVRADVHGETLVVEVQDRRRDWWPWRRGSGKVAQVTINLRELDRIESAGAITVIADKLQSNELDVDLAGACTLKIAELQATKLKLGGSGATKIDVAGKVTRQDIDLSGAGSYEAGQLASDEASISVSGAGKAVVNARNTLAVDISGAGKVEYFGEPKLKQSISGIGKVSRRERS